MHTIEDISKRTGKTCPEIQNSTSKLYIFEVQGKTTNDAIYQLQSHPNYKYLQQNSEYYESYNVISDGWKVEKKYSDIINEKNRVRNLIKSLWSL